MMEKEAIEELKQGVDLVALIRSRGIELKRSGRSFRGLCPFHSEKEPSFTVNPKERLWQCFGCGKGGDAIRFVELMDKVGFKEAVEKLGGPAPRERSQNGGSARKTEPSPPAPEAGTPRTTDLSVRAIKLLTRVVDFYHTAFAEDARAAEYLASRGITDNHLFSSFKIGFANGTLLKALPDEGDITSELKNLGILNDRGSEHFHGCVTFPLLDASGNPVSLYGRRVEGMEKSDGPPHLYLPGPRLGLFNRQAARSGNEIILTESIIDSLTLMNAGIENTIPCYGVNGLTAEHLELLRSSGVEAVHICFDADELGRNGAAAIAGRISGFRLNHVDLPEGCDINSFFLGSADAKEHFLALTRAEGPGAAETASALGAGDAGGGEEITAHSPAPDWEALKEEKEAVKEKREIEIKETDSGFTAAFGGRIYDVRGIAKEERKLRATVKGTSEKGGSRRFFVDTVDFYSARSRAFLAKGFSDLFSQAREVISLDLDQLMELCERYRPPDARTTAPAQMSEEERREAISFLENPDLFQEILKDFETLGYTGEETNKLLCYIAAVSRKMEEPLSVMIQSRSAAGKSFLQDTVLSLMPEDETIKYTRLTDQALFYKEAGSLKHKILAIEELDGMGGAVYSIRSIQSSKKITIAYTSKDPATGRLRTDDNTVEGPLMIFITTTADEVEGETASRFLFISIDESSEMTEKILQKQRERRTIQGMLTRCDADRIRRKHGNANRLLEPVRIVNPYAPLLTFSSRSLRARRDHTKYLNLIDAVTCLFQYQRSRCAIDHGGQEIEYIRVILSDIEKANAIACEVLGRSLDELSPPSRRLLSLIRDMVIKRCREKEIPPESFHFTRRDIREFCGWSDYQVKTHVKQLEDLEYIYPAAGKKGKEYVYELVAVCEMTPDRPFLIGITGMDELRQKAIDAGIDDE